jgi:secreted PhoX family phosphatase
MTRGGTSTVEVTPHGEVVRAFTSLNGTQMNCSGGPMPWGSWISCEETVNGPDVGPDFTGAPNVALQQRHGFIFEVPAGGQSNRQPITSAGRFAHESVAFDPAGGALYLTEDNFGFPSGFYRYLPPANPMKRRRLLNGGRLQMLAVVGEPNAHLERNQPAGTRYRATWVNIADPAPTFPYIPGQPAPTSNNDALTHVGNQGRALGAAHFSRLEGATHDDGVVYFTSTQGGGAAETGPDTVTGYGNGNGQVWAYHVHRRTLTLVYQSPGPDTLDFPDNITTSRRGTLVVCEDNVNDNYVRGLTPGGRLFNIALNRLRSGTGTDRSNDEFAGTTFSPDGRTLFVNIQASAGMSFAIWGPWARIGV